MKYFQDRIQCCPVIPYHEQGDSGSNGQKMRIIHGKTVDDAVHYVGPVGPQNLGMDQAALENALQVHI